MNTCVVIQCRYDSKRLPGKILKELEPGLLCLDYIVKRAMLTGMDVVIATTAEDEDLPIVHRYLHLKNRYKDKLRLFTGDKLNIAKRLFNATEGYDNFIRITGDDLFVDTMCMAGLKGYAQNKKLDYAYTSIIRGCDCDYFNRAALKRAIVEYDTTRIESIEFLFKNGKFNAEKMDVPASIDNDINGYTVTMDTEDDWKLVHIIYKKIGRGGKYFGATDVAEVLHANQFLTSINKTPTLTVYTVFKDYPVQWLSDAINSLRLQTFTDYEYILIDYGSKMIHKFFKDFHNTQLHKTYMVEDMNFIDAVKFAISKASGKYILRLDADDILFPTALERMVSVFKEHGSKISAVIPNHDRFSKEDIIWNYDGEVDNVMSCCMIEKKKYQYVNFMEKQAFRDGTNLLKHFKDYDFEVAYLKESLFRYRIHDKSLTHGTGNEELIKETDMMINGK